MVQIILQPAEEKNHEWIIILQPADSRTGTEQCLRFKSAPYTRHLINKDIYIEFILNSISPPGPSVMHFYA